MLGMLKVWSIQKVPVSEIHRWIRLHPRTGRHEWRGNVAAGTNEILNRTVARRLLKGDTEL